MAVVELKAVATLLTAMGHQELALRSIALADEIDAGVKVSIVGM